MLRFAILLLFNITVIANVCNQPIFSSKKLDNNLSKINITANTSTIRDNTYTLNDSVEIMSKDYYISADKMIIDTKNKNYKASGNIKAQTNNLLFSANNLVIDNKQKIKLNADNITYSLLTNNTRGKAQKITIDKVQSLDNATYSSCGLSSPSWLLTADNITIDKDKNLASVENVSFEFFGIPLFWLPKYYFVIEGRQTGILHPQFSFYNHNNENGVIFTQPYYFNLALEKDLTLALTHLSTRGEVIEAEYRHLIAKNKDDGYLQINAEYLVEDKETGDKRWLIDGKYNAKINDLKLDINLHKASDKNYLSQIKHSDIERLESNINLNYVGNNFSANIFSEKHQVIDNNNIYTKDLELNLNKTIKLKDINYNFNIINTQFNHQDNNKITGIRNYIRLDISKSILGDFYSITPQINFANTKYDVVNTSNKNLNMFGVNIDSKIFFKRELNLFGKNLTQNLTPRIAYFYNPNKNQDNLPNFDSEPNQLNYNSIFENNNWSGLDRVDFANNIALGLSTNLIDNKTGKEYFNFGIGQNFNLQDDTKSNLFMKKEFNIGSFNIFNSLEYDNKIIARDSFIGYKSDNNFINIGHHKADNKDYLSANFSFDINNKFNIFGGIKREMDNKITNKKTLGFLYNSCCFALRVAHFNSYNDDFNDDDTTTRLEFIFKELGSSDSDLYQQIKAEIPNYIKSL